MKGQKIAISQFLTSMGQIDLAAEKLKIHIEIKILTKLQIIEE